MTFGVSQLFPGVIPLHFSFGSLYRRSAGVGAEVTVNHLDEAADDSEEEG